MKVLIQRVKKASVTIEGQLYSSIEKGILALVGIEKGDTLEQVEKAARKIANLRIFPDENDKMNRSLIDIEGTSLKTSFFSSLLWLEHPARVLTASTIDNNLISPAP